MNTKGVNFQPSKKGQFSAAVDKSQVASFLLAGVKMPEAERWP
jgi:hypothetical protein